jgi:GntR family transcriptional regulator, transcriptional repressor for pyruvate dehydrogenase complex
MRRASDEVLAVLLDALRGGLYEPGDPLPPERDLAQQLKISRKVLRDAIEVLREQGIVTVRRGARGGAYVASLENVARVSASIQGQTRASLRSLLEVRRAIECAAVVLTAERATEADLASLQRLVVMLDEADDRPKEFWEVDIRFHFSIADTSRNPLLPEFLRDVFNRLDSLRQQFPYAYVPHPEAIANQRTTLLAIESRDRQRALRAMEDHLGSLEVVLLGARLPLPVAMPAGGV